MIETAAAARRLLDRAGAASRQVGRGRVSV